MPREEQAPEYRAPETSAQRAARYIRRRISEGSMPPGSRISQHDVAEAVGVSRIPVRDALFALEREGVVRMEANKGAFVEEIDADIVEDHFKLYGLILGVAVERTTKRLDDDVRAELEAIRDTVRARASADTIATAGLEFQNLVRRVGASRRLRAVAQGLSGIVPGNFFAEVDGAIPATRTSLPTIIEAMLAGDVDTAVGQYVAWQRRNGQLVIEQMRRRRLIT